MQNRELVIQFYTAFARYDYEGMVACYHTDIEFTDPAFGKLKGEQAKAMWKMLLERSGGNLKIAFQDITANDVRGTAHWEAFYTFSKTGRAVHNRIDAAFEFKDGKIIRHVDSFNLWHWSRQALGVSGWLLGHTSYFRKKLQHQTNQTLKEYMNKNKR